MKTKTGFTLKELLGVIAIITILAAILLPVFAKAIEGEKAKQAKCISNLKQLGQAFIQYKEDYNNTYPVLYKQLGTYKYAYWTQLVAPYMKTPRILQCPSDSEALIYDRSPGDIYTDGIICKLANGTYSTQQSSYIYNYNVTGKIDSTIPNPANVFLNWDGMHSMWYFQSNYAAYPEPNGYDRMRTYKYDSSNPDWQWSRHTKGDNYAFCDGHVRWFKRSAVPSDNRTGAVNNPALNDPRWGDNL